MYKKPIKLLKLIIIYITLILIVTGCKSGSIEYDAISLTNIESIISELTSSKYQGRLAGTEGNELSIDYIIDQYKEIGLKNPQELDNYQQNYPQKVRIVNQTPKLELVDNNGNLIKSYKYIDDFTIVTNWSNIKLNGDIIAPTFIYEKRSYQIEEIEERFGLLSKEAMSELNISALGIVRLSLEYDSYGVIIERELNSTNYPYPKFPVAPNTTNVSVNNSGPIVYYVSSFVYDEIIEEIDNGALIHTFIDCSIVEVEPANVIGFIPGKSDEYIIIGAHLDHVGANGDGSYNPGALDNASGIAGLLEIARVIKESRVKLDKTVVFIAFNGEEEGLFGSKYYVENPIFPLSKSTVINLDMIGSKTIVPLQINLNNEDTNQLGVLFKSLANDLNIEISSSTEGSSDHTPFNYKGVDAITLIHYDISRYHTPMDTVDNVDSKRVKEVIKLVLSYIKSDI